MDEIDAKLAIYRLNLGQNSRWNLKLPFKINFGCWITIWKQSGRWISLLMLGFKFGRRIIIWKQSGCWISLLTMGFKFGRWINTGVIWAVRSHWRERGDFLPKIAKKSAIHGILKRFIHKIADLSPIADFLAIFGEKSPRRHAIYRRYFADIFRLFPPWI